jgi:[acyl-carrier-protein] S-malonyltransferase
MIAKSGALLQNVGDMNIVALFSGQGAQKVGMGKDFYSSSTTAQTMMSQADDVLGYDLTSIMFDGPDDELMRTAHCQPALYLHGLVAQALLLERLPQLTVVATAGLSLGEFTAHAAAGTFSFADGLRLVARRGAFMEEACRATQGSMAALIGGEEASIRELAAACDVDVANLNAPGQIVLSGSIAGIDAVVEKAKDFGIRRAIKLNVAGAYHSRLMQSAQDLLAAEMSGVSMLSPRIPVVCNYGASVVSEPSEIRNMLEKQVTGSVRWIESIELLCAQGHTKFIEFGPGKVLAGLVAKINKDVEVVSIEDLASLDSVCEKWG